MNYFTILTNSGASAIADAVANSTDVKLTKMAVGDGNIVPNSSMTSLSNETYRFDLNRLSLDPANPGYLVAEGIISGSVGGFNVSEVAVYTEDDILFAIGSLPETYKPLLSEGSAKDLNIKMIIEVANAEVVSLLVDDEVVTATKEYVSEVLSDYLLISNAVTEEYVAEVINTLDKKLLTAEALSLQKLNGIDTSVNNLITSAFEGIATKDRIADIRDSALNRSVINTPSIIKPTDNDVNFLANIDSSEMSLGAGYLGKLDYVKWQLSTVADFSTLVDEKDDSLRLSYPLRDVSSFTKYYIRVRYGIDNHLSPWSNPVSFTTPVNGIVSPYILGLEDGAIITSNSLVVNSSSYKTVGATGIHLNSDWELSSNKSFTNIVKSSYAESGNRTTWNITGLEADKIYYIRARHRSTGFVSPYSTPVKFVTPAAYLATPAINIVGAPDDILIKPSLTGSAFTMVGATDSHVSTDWQILKASDNSVVWQSLGNTINKLSINVDVSLAIETEYIFRVRYNGINFTSQYGEQTGNTINIYVKNPKLVVKGDLNDIGESPILTTNPFSVENGTDTHVSTDWRVIRVSNGSTVWQNLENTVDKISIVVPKGLLVVNTEYRFEARHNGSVYGSSEWSTVTGITSDTFLYKGILAVGHTSSPNITLYGQDADNLVKLPDPAALPTSTGLGVAFSPDNNYLAVAHQSTPYIIIYKRNGDTFTKLANPGVLPASSAYSVAVSPS